MLRKSQKLLQQLPEFQDQETTHLRLAREWEFLVQWQDLETILSMRLKAWHDLVLQDRAHQDQEQDLMVEQLVPAEQDLVGQAAHAQDLVLQNLAWAAELLEDSQVVQQLAVEAAELVAVPQVHLVKVAQEVKAKLENQSALREKNSNKEVFQALVEQLFQEEMAQQ
jgi:hypothetical protein